MQNKIFAKFLTGSGAYAVSQAVVIYAITYFGGSKAAGIFSYGLAISVPVAMFFNIGLRAAVAADVQKVHKDSDYKNTRNIMSILGFFVCLALSVFLEDDLYYIACMVIIAAAKSLEGGFDLSYGFMQRNGMQNEIAKSLLLRAIFNTSFVIISLVIFGDDLIFVCCAYFLSFLFCGLLDKKIIKPDEPKGKFSIKKVFDIVAENIPVGAAGLFTSAFVSVPRFAIKYSSGYDVLGVYTVASTAPQFGSIVASSLGQASISFWTKHENDSIKIKNSIKKIIKINTLFSILSFVFCIVAFIINKNFNFIDVNNQYILLMAVLFLAALPGYVLNSLGYFMVKIKEKKFLLYSQFWRLLVVSVLCHWLIPYNELFGAAFAIFLSSLIVLCIYIRKVFK